MRNKLSFPSFGLRRRDSREPHSIDKQGGSPLPCRHKANDTDYNQVNGYDIAQQARPDKNQYACYQSNYWLKGRRQIHGNLLIFFS